MRLSANLQSRAAATGATATVKWQPGTTLAHRTTGEHLKQNYQFKMHGTFRG